MDDPRNIFVSQRQDYHHQQQPSGQQYQQTGQTSNSTPKTDPQAEYNRRVAEMKQLAEKYQREGEGQLVKDIVNTVIEQKARGQLTNDQLVAFAKRITPMLNVDQRQRLNELVEQLLKL